MQRLFLIAFLLVLLAGGTFFVFYDSKNEPALPKTISPPFGKLSSPPPLPSPKKQIKAVALSLENGQKTVLQITGEDFGSAKTSSSLFLESQTGPIEISSKDPRIQEWTDHEIRVVLPLARVGSTVRVENSWQFIWFCCR